MDLASSERVTSSVTPHVLPDESTLSQSLSISEDDVENSRLLPRHLSVCEECWRGPFAMHFGLPLVSPQSGQWYRHWPEEISYSASLAELESRADTGCVWCLFLLRMMARLGCRYDPEPDDRLAIIVRGTTDTWNEDTGYSQRPYQRIDIEIEDYTEFEALVHAEPDDLAASYIPTRSPLRDVGSPSALALARQKIDECVHEHQCCKSAASSDPPLPTRVVDCANPARPQLVSTAGRCGEYLALSYVWGGDQVHKTTKKNISAYEQIIAPPDPLPATIRDAIRVTHMLGFRWLWIDSLCIIQDSDEDKARELGRMHNIYRYAHLTIMAGSAAGVGEGFLQERPPPDPIAPDNIMATLPFICPPQPDTCAGCSGDRSVVQRPVGTVSVVSLGSDIIGGSYNYELGRMSTRAWCMQEYLMSPRALIFTPTSLLLRCLTTTQAVGDSFCHIYDEPRIPRSLFLPTPAPEAEPSSEEWKGMHTAWMAVVEDYTRRAAGFESDKLVACAAIAEQFHGALCCEYLAGLWRSDALLVHLLWMSDTQQDDSDICRHTRPTDYRAPSWSWAAIEGPIVSEQGHSPNTVDFEDPKTVALAEVVECWVTPTNPALPFGQVKDGSLSLRGTLIPCNGGPAKMIHGKWYMPLPSFQEAWRQQRGLDDTLSLDEEGSVRSTEPREGAMFVMDCDVDELPGSMWLVPFEWWSNSDGHRWVHGIVLELAPPRSSSGSESQKIRFWRIGYFLDRVEANSEHPLWDPLIQRAAEDEEHLWTEIVIV
ncbi:HET-domain-containing protein [Trametes versicolor FP-101664 SS1]|uniref:HET-domain-containing protein n=1 Tax=Trametes versicolor (strain FP-101664) TaxID=717944 RepID=UPI0004623759|nr:HET-domain-containing protein [Trametes versicolor FP-101664 SS1]EIW59715.1 HET-domain-containing protein [Trametes versicolor FP-101664 SS1]